MKTKKQARKKPLTIELEDDPVEQEKEPIVMQAQEESPMTEPIMSHSDPSGPIEAAGNTFDASSEPVIEMKSDSHAVEVEAAKVRATKFMDEGNFSEARKALEKAESIGKEPRLSAVAASRARLHRFASGVESRMRRNANASQAEAKAKEQHEQEEADAASLTAVSVEKALKIVDTHSKIAAGVGLLPTFVLNFAGVLVVQVTMVWKIAKAFHQPHGKDRIRGSVLSLIGSVLPGTVGHGIGMAVAAIPAIVTGTVLSFVLAPALAYATTRAVGNVYIMHFESGGTLLTFDPRSFREHFVREFQKAGGAAAGAAAPASV